LGELVPGTVMFFDLTVCPAGWSEYLPARGRTIVGAPAGGESGWSTGTPLANVELRQHSHSVDLPSFTTPDVKHSHFSSLSVQSSSGGNHSHTVTQTVQFGLHGTAAGMPTCTETAAFFDHAHTVSAAPAHTHTFSYTAANNEQGHTHTVDIGATPSTAVDSPAPYIQYLACKKN
jgi:hypothetical protein